MATLPLKLNGEFRPDLDSKLCGRLTNPQPARFGVGATRLAFEERDPLVSKFRQMLQRQPSSLVIVQDDGSYPLQMSGWGYRHGWDWNAAMQRGIHKDQAFDGAVHQPARIFVDQILASAVTHHKIEVAILQQAVFDSAHDESRVALADLGNDDSDRERSLFAQMSRVEVGAVVKFPGSAQDPGFGFFRY